MGLDDPRLREERANRSSIAIHGERDSGGAAPPPGPQYQELWFRLAREPWHSLVLVPADEGTSVGHVATALAEVGRRLRQLPVTAFVAESLDYASAGALTDLQRHVYDGRHGADSDAELVATAANAPGGADAPPPGEPDPPAPPRREAALLPPFGQVIIAIAPVVVEPLGIAVAQGADAVILCVELKRTRLRSARRTMDLVGPARFRGAFLVR